jgi:hypothetical protein
MPNFPFEDVVVEFSGEDKTKFGLFPIFAWYMMEVIDLKAFFNQVTVKRKRNHNEPLKRRKPKYTAADMCVGIITGNILGLSRLWNIKDVLGTETALAEMIGLPEFFDQSTGHLFLDEFQAWHIRQLDQASTNLLLAFGESPRQDVLVVDIDSTTHSLESRQREKAVVGFNKIKPGKPCYQWSVAFVRGEVVAQKLMAGDTNCKTPFQELVRAVKEKLNQRIAVVRLDGGYFSAENLEFTVAEGLQIITTERYDWIMARKPKMDPNRWLSYDEKTRLYDLGLMKVVSTTELRFRVVLVEKEQVPFNRKLAKLIRYAIIENLAFRLDAQAVYEFYHGRQSIENYFKESKNPFSSGKMPSGKFRANEAYLQLVAMAGNLYTWFKKNFFLRNGRVILWEPSARKCSTTELCSSQKGRS